MAGKQMKGVYLIATLLLVPTVVVAFLYVAERSIRFRTFDGTDIMMLAIGVIYASVVYFMYRRYFSRKSR